MKKRTYKNSKKSNGTLVHMLISGFVCVILITVGIEGQTYFVHADDSKDPTKTEVCRPGLKGAICTQVNNEKSPAKIPSDIATDRVIVKYKKGLKDTEKATFLSKHKGKLRKRISQINADIVSVDNTTVKDTIDQFKKDDDVAYVEPDYIGKVMEVPNDPGYNQYQWDLNKVSLPAAWNLTHGSSNVIIGMIDSGVDTTHADLAGKVLATANFTDESDPTDLLGHGTATSGVAAEATNNGLGFAGAGYNSRLIVAKAVRGDGFAYASWIANGVIWAADHGAKVINLSLGFTDDPQTLRDAIDYAWNKNIVIVASAGNNSNSQLVYPASYGDVISVAATDENDNKTSFSTYGPWVLVAAPGVDVAAPLVKNGYSSTANGTSFSAPIVSGIAALMWARNPNLSQYQLASLILTSADRIAGTGTYWAWGRVNAYNAVYLAASQPYATPYIIPTSIPTSSMTPILSDTPTAGPPTATPTITNTPTLTFTPTPTPTKAPIATPTPVTYSIKASADSYVNSKATGTNYGTSTTLNVNGSPADYGYLKFDLSSLAGKTIVSAVLNIAVYNDGSTNTQNIKPVSSTSWSESTITYNNRPAITNTVLGTVKSNNVKNAWQQVLLTSTVAANTGKVMSLGIDATGTDNISFYSKEAGAAPTLVIQAR